MTKNSPASAWKVRNPNFDARVRDLFAATPFVAHLGAEVLEVGPGKCDTQLRLRPEHLQQNGYAHAGVLATLADHTAGGAAISLAEAQAGVLSIEFKVNLLRPGRGPLLVCEARVLKPGKSISVVQAEIFNAAQPDKLIAQACITLAMVESEATRP